MFAFSIVTLLAALIGFLAHGLLAAAQESHQVTMSNNCGSGSPVFQYFENGNDTNPQGPTTISGQLLGGIAWLTDFAGADCLDSGVNCAVVEFTLRNDAPNQNGADFDLLAQPQNGNHQFTYAMAFNFFGACTTSAECLEADCPEAITGPGGVPFQCIGSNVGINIVFCPLDV